MANLNRSEDNNLLLALRHPLRRRILREDGGQGDDQPARAVRPAPRAAQQRLLPRPSPGRLRRGDAGQHETGAGVDAALLLRDGRGALGTQVLGLDELDGGTAGRVRPPGT